MSSLQDLEKRWFTEALAGNAPGVVGRPITSNTLVRTSSSLTQNPTGIGDLATIPISWGEVDVLSDSVDYLGGVGNPASTRYATHFKEAGDYQIEFAVHLTRTGGAQGAAVVFYSEFSLDGGTTWISAPESGISPSFSDASSRKYTQLRTDLVIGPTGTFPAGVHIRQRIARLGPNDDGGLVAIPASGTIPASPSAFYQVLTKTVA